MDAEVSMTSLGTMCMALAGDSGGTGANLACSGRRDIAGDLLPGQRATSVDYLHAAQVMSRLLTPQQAWHPAGLVNLSLVHQPLSSGQLQAATFRGQKHADSALALLQLCNNATADKHRAAPAMDHLPAAPQQMAVQMLLAAQPGH